MEKYCVNFDALEVDITPKKASYRLSDVANRIEKVAFDVVRFRDDADTEQLWQIKQTEEGPVIIALYDESGSLKAESKLDWEAIAEKKTASVHLFYKSEPVIKITAAEANVPADEVDLLARWLPNSLASDTELQVLVLKKMARDNRDLFVGKYPEFKKIAALARI
jgi:hypothetical protein